MTDTDWFRARPRTEADLIAAPKQATPTPELLKVPASRWTPAKTPTARMPSLQPTKKQDQKQRVSAQVVMHQFNRSEVRSLDANADALYERVRDKLWAMPEFKRFSVDDMADLIGRLTGRLQDSDLTINFDATKWFSTPNEYKSYFQMYASKAFVGTREDGSRELRLPPDKLGSLNPTKPRDAADDKVTFDKNIDSPERSGIARLMRTGGVVSQKGPDGKSYFKITNGQFNPKARQIFAALNYGRRPGGSTTLYGKSVLILNAALKRNAIYYMGDTFDLDASHRLTYGTLAGVFLHAKSDVLPDLLNACYRMVPLKDTEDAHRLLEAHIYGTVTFAHDVTEMRIANSEAPGDVLKNAKLFTTKYTNIKLSWVDTENTG